MEARDYNTFENIEDPEAGINYGEIDIEDAWTVIRSYFKQHGLVSQ